MKRLALISIFTFFIIVSGFSQEQDIKRKEDFKTYCNPLDIDYSYMSHYRASHDVSYRSGADPAIVRYKGILKVPMPRLRLFIKTGSLLMVILQAGVRSLKPIIPNSVTGKRIMRC